MGNDTDKFVFEAGRNALTKAQPVDDVWNADQSGTTEWNDKDEEIYNDLA